MKDIAARLQEEREIDSKTEDSNYETPISSSEYNEESIRITTYLTILKKPRGISIPEFQKFK